MSNNVGIVKAIDSLGRVVIPKEMRERFGFIEKRGRGKYTYLNLVRGCVILYL